jgi:hypothetical protein
VGPPEEFSSALIRPAEGGKVGASPTPATGWVVAVAKALPAGRPPSRAASRIPATACTAGASKATITLPAHKIERRVSGALELGNQPYSTDGAAPMAAVLDDFDAARTGRLRGHTWPFNDVDGAAREEQDSLNWRGRSSWRPRPSNFARFEPHRQFHAMNCHKVPLLDPPSMLAGRNVQMGIREDGSPRLSDLDGHRRAVRRRGCRWKHGRPQLGRTEALSIGNDPPA